MQMLVDDIGDVTITNDGATILKMLEVEHPAAKVCILALTGFLFFLLSYLFFLKQLAICNASLQLEFKCLRT